MNFKVISQSTKEREQEIIDLFNKTKERMEQLENEFVNVVISKEVGKNDN